MQKKIIFIIIRIKQFFFFIVTVLFFRKRLEKNPKTIVVFRTCLLGDFLFSLPAVNVLRNSFPESKIIYLTTYASSKVTTNSASKYFGSNKKSPWFDFIIPDLVDEVVELSDLSIAGIKRTNRYIRNLNPDLFILLPHPGDSFRSLIKKIIFFYSIGVRKNFFGWCVKGDYGFFLKLQYENGYLGHKVEGPLRAIKELSKFYSLKEIPISFPIKISKLKSDWSNEYLKLNYKKGIKLGISVGSIQEHKQWPIEKFRELAELIDSEYDVTFFIFGTSGQEKLFKVFENSIFRNGLFDLIGKTDIGQLASIMESLDLVIANDGGAAHLAASVNTPVISIISGIEFPNSIEPWGNFDNVVRFTTDCSPCYSMTYCPLGHNNCIKSISVISVYEKFQKIALTLK